MYINDNYVSPYLRRPPQSQQQVTHQQTKQDRRDTGDVEFSR